MNLTLQQLFGVNATQNSQSLVIAKADLPLLTPSSVNSAESLLAAILITALSTFEGVLTDENNNPVSDVTGEMINYDNKMLYILTLELWGVSILNQKIIHEFVVNQYQEYAN